MKEFRKTISIGMFPATCDGKTVKIKISHTSASIVCNPYSPMSSSETPCDLDKITYDETNNCYYFGEYCVTPNKGANHSLLMTKIKRKSEESVIHDMCYKFLT